MDQVFSKTGSGLLVPDKAVGDERAIAKLLREHDSDLRLVPQANGYRVYRYAGSDRPSEFILYWGDSLGRPYPLSSALVEAVKTQDKNTRAEYKSPEQINQELRERRQKQTESDMEALISDWKSREGKSALLPRGQSLRRAREKTGYHHWSKD